MSDKDYHNDRQFIEDNDVRGTELRHVKDLLDYDGPLFPDEVEKVRRRKALGFYDPVKGSAVPGKNPSSSSQDIPGGCPVKSCSVSSTKSGNFSGSSVPASLGSRPGDDYYLRRPSFEQPGVVKVGKLAQTKDGKKYVRLSPFGKNYVYYCESVKGCKGAIDVDSHQICTVPDSSGKARKLTPTEKAFRSGYIARGKDEYNLWRKNPKMGN